MAITIQQIKELREATAAGMGACKEALAATVPILSLKRRK